MGGSSNPGNFLNPKNLVPAILTGGLSYGLSSFKRASQPPQLPDPAQNKPPDPSAYPHATEDTPETLAERQRKLKALQYGFASTITNKPSLAPAQLATPTATPLKTKLGQ